MPRAAAARSQGHDWPKASAGGSAGLDGGRRMLSGGRGAGKARDRSPGFSSGRLQPRHRRRASAGECHCRAWRCHPGRVLPPVEFCRGTSQTHAAKSRPDRKIDGSGSVAAICEAMIGPMPRIVARRRATASDLVRAMISALSVRPASRSRRTWLQARETNCGGSREVADRSRLR